MGYNVTEVILSQKAPEHITGYPYVIEGVMHYSRPDWWPTQPKMILFLDELKQASIPVQNVAMQLIHERRVGPHALPDDCIVIAAGNRASDRAGSTVMQTALRTRFFPVFEIEPTKDEWCDYAMGAGFHPLVIAYVKSIRKNVLEFDPATKGGFVSPRTLEQAGHCMSAFNDDIDNPDLVAALHGVLGDGGAGELIAYAQTLAKLPSYNDIKDNPQGAAVVPEMSEAIGRMLTANGRYGHMTAVSIYIERYSPEIQAKLVKSLNDSMLKHPDIEELATKLGLANPPD